MSVYYQDAQVTLHHGHALTVARELPTGSVNCIVTSPPFYGLRDYEVEGQYGLEATPAEYVDNMRVLFGELRRILADDGTLWLNLGDSYTGSWGNQGHSAARSDLHTSRRMAKQYKTGTRTGSIRPGMPPAKNLLGIPWRVAFALQDDGWILRNAIIWHKPNAMPESVRDRLSNRYEHVFLFSKQQRYWFDLDPIRDPTPDIGRKTKATVKAGPLTGGHGSMGQDGNGMRMTEVYNNPAGRNPGNVWALPTAPFAEAHFAVYPPALPTRCVLAGCKPGGAVLDPFSGSGTTGLAAQRTGRRYIGIDLKAEYLELSLRTRLRDAALDFQEGA